MRQAHVVRLQLAASIGVPSASIACHCSSRVRLGDARRLRGCACTLIVERRTSTSHALDARPVIGAARRGIAACGERDVALAGEQPGGRVEADPAGAGQVDLGPGVQVGEVAARRRRARRATSRPATSWIR